MAYEVNNIEANSTKKRRSKFVLKLHGLLPYLSLMFISRNFLSKSAKVEMQKQQCSIKNVLEEDLFELTSKKPRKHFTSV